MYRERGEMVDVVNLTRNENIRGKGDTLKRNNGFKIIFRHYFKKLHENDDSFLSST